MTYDTGWNLLAERRLDGTQVGEYIHGLRTDEILRADLQLKLSTSTPTSVYPLADGLGSTVALANDHSDVTQRYRYDAFGTPHVLSTDYRPLSTGSAYRFLFTGQEWLAQVGLNDHRNRYYSPGMGRWMSTDPIKFNGGLNLNAFIGNSPANNTDPLGLVVAPGGSASYNNTVNIDILRSSNTDPMAQSLWNVLQSSPYTFTVLPPPPGEGNSFVASTVGAGGGTIYYDPSNLNRAGDQSGDPMWGLTHEAGHAFQRNQGRFTNEVDPNTGLSRNEHEAVQIENIVRPDTNQRITYVLENGTAVLIDDPTRLSSVHPTSPCPP